MPESIPILEMTGINKSFPGVKALSDVDFCLYQGEVHALMGQNGAGKSTLIKCLTGVYRQESGSVFLEGQPIRPHSPLDAQRLGISTVYQEINLCPNLTVAENIFIGRQPMKSGRIDWKSMNKRAEELLKKLNLRIDVTQLLASYSAAIQQMVAIVRVLDISAKVLILDEPTSSLDEKEVESLFKVIRKLRDDGLGIIFITHFLEQVFAISDRITVLRNGEPAGTYETHSFSQVDLITRMMGRAGHHGAPWRGAPVRNEAERCAVQKPLLRAEGLGRRGAIAPCDLEVNTGEVLGLAGLLGSGRTEIARLLFGIDRADEGRIFVDDRPANLASPRHAIAQGFGFCPEDRKTSGIIEDLTVRENIILALQAKRGVFKTLSRKKQEEIAERYISTLDILTPSANQTVKFLSGGNQQKVILARWLAMEPRFLILDEPTRGIDVGAKAEIQHLILSLSKEGISILFISAEFSEVVRCSHRIVILRDKAKITELNGTEIDEQSIMHAIAGGKKADE